MKNFIKSLLIIIICSFIIFFLNDYISKDYSMKVFSDKLSYDLVYKGIHEARDFIYDEENNCYIAYKDRIQFVGNDGKSYNIIKDEKLDIFSMEYYKNKLYFSSNTSIFELDLRSNQLSELIKDLPNWGDYNKSLIRVSEDLLYISIGASTNSGVVGEDNLWTEIYMSGHDISPYDITLAGMNFGDPKRGAFVAQNSKTLEEQVISGHCPGNASIIIYNLNTEDSATFAWGIRNIKGMDFNSRSKLIASVGGMENRGLRPIKGDLDYIYEIKSKKWYGWPDYSGGDPVSSPKFIGTDNKIVLPILKNPPNTNPPAPLYQHKSLNSLESIAIDKNGDIGNIDEIYYYDMEEKAIYSLDNDLTLCKVIKLEKKGNIASMKFYNKNLYILNEADGTLYKIYNESNINDSIKFYKIIFWILILFIFVLVCYFIYTVVKSNKSKLN
ncbi:PQQ-dependent sugar dehydrogenase [Clostridium sediminicola]|uniref:hypothetical protein n=1 Tax=Clostridium sediminicola TaxID=3114879 RepID=UPI0031F255DC